MQAPAIHTGQASSLNRIPVRVEVFGFEDWTRIAPRWAELNLACQGSVFLSPEWIGVWLEVFGRELGTEILLVEESGILIGACLASRFRGGLRWLPLRRLSLNASGEARMHTTYAEYNDLLCRPGSESIVRQALIAHLDEMEWDELMIEGFVPDDSYRTICDRFSGLERSEVKHPSYFVDLAAIRASNATYESALRGKTRKHLRQHPLFRRSRSVEADCCARRRRWPGDVR